MLSYLLFISCAKVPKVLLDPYNHSHPECPKEENFMSVGVGDDPSSAIENGHRKVAEQISSEISSQTDTISEYREMSSNGLSDSSTKEEFISNIKTKTSFKHNELIKDVIAPINHQGKFYTLSCLNKNESADVLSEKLQPQIEEFFQSKTEALNALAKQDILAFSSSYNNAIDLKDEIMAEFYIIRSISGKKHSKELKVRKGISELMAEVSAVHSQLDIGASVSGQHLSLSSNELLDKMFLSIFINSGVSSSSSTRCSENLSHHAELTLESNCGSNQFGIFCKPALFINLTDCNSKRVNTVSVYQVPKSATSSKGFEDATYKALMKHQDDLQQNLLTKLRTILPI